MCSGKKYCTAINFTMCFLELRLLRIAGECDLYCNLTNWEKGTWGELPIGVLGKVPDEE